MYEEYYILPKQPITKQKAEKFLSKQYYKIYHILTLDTITRYIGPYSEYRHKFIYAPSWLIIKNMATKWKIPVVLPLNCCKGFVHTNLLCLRKTYPECSFNEFDFIPVSTEEVIAAYGLTIQEESKEQ